MSNAILECSGVGDGGIARVLSELVRYWPATGRITVVGAPANWEPAAQTVAEVSVAGYQSTSRGRTITAARSALAQATDRHARDRPAVLSLSPSLAISGSRLPVTTMVHDLAFRLWPRDLSQSVLAYRRASYGYAIRQSAALISVSARTQHDLLGLYGVAPERCTVWTPGTDLPASPGGPLPEPLPAIARAGGSYLLIAGHAPHKGVELAIEAMSLIPDRHLAVLTGGRRSPVLEELAARSPHRDRIHFLGRLSDAEYATAVHQAAAFLMPSHFEGYGLPAVEAMRLGTPAVISPDPALGEATEGAAHRMLRWDAAALADAVDRAGRHTGAVPMVGRTWQAAARHLFEILFGVAAPGGAGPAPDGTALPVWGTYACESDEKGQAG